MDVLSFLRVLLRRWYLVVPIVIASLLGSAYFWETAPSTYEATGTLLLKNPTGIDDETARENPYLGYGGLYVPGKVATDVVGARDYRLRLAEVGVNPTYELVVDTTTQAPIVFVRVEGATESEAVGSVAAVISAVQSALKDRQAETGAPEASWVTTEVLTAPPDATPLYSSKLRGVAAILAVGGLLTLGLVFGVEGVVRRRRGDREVPIEDTPETEVPCSLCGSWFPTDRLIRHLQVQHGLADHRPAQVGGDSARDVAASHRAGRTSRRHERRSAVPVGVAAPRTEAERRAPETAPDRAGAKVTEKASAASSPPSPSAASGTDGADNPPTPRQRRRDKQDRSETVVNGSGESPEEPIVEGRRPADPTASGEDGDSGPDPTRSGRRTVAAKFGP